MPRAATQGDAALAWATTEEHSTRLLSGFAVWDRADAEPKTLNYEEIILVLEGSFGIQLTDGQRLVAGPGDVLHIPEGTTVKYEGVKAKLFFAITPPKQSL